MGKLERLEAREVLSASFGGAHYTSEPIAVATASWDAGETHEVRDVEAQNIAIDYRPPAGGFHDDFRQEGGNYLFSELAYSGGERVFVSYWQPPRLVFGARWEPGPVLVVHHTVYSYAPPTVNAGLGGDIESPVARPPGNEVSQPRRAQASVGPTEPPQLDFESGASPSPPGTRRTASSTPPTSSETGATLRSLYEVDLPATIAAGPISAVSLRAHDAAFQGLSSQQLLLAANRRVADGLDSDDDLESRRGLFDDENEEFAAFSKTRLRDDVTEALDTLTQEREAIDRVLAELHNVGPLADHETTDAAAARRPAQTESAFATGAYKTPADRRADADRQSTPTATGMVLLAATGDANSSPYDLTAAIISGAYYAAGVATGAEAAVGMYQAFDVGGAEPLDLEIPEAPLGDAAISQSAAIDREPGA